MLLNPVPVPSYFPSFNFPLTSLEFCNSSICFFNFFISSLSADLLGFSADCSLPAPLPPPEAEPVLAPAFFSAFATADFIPLLVNVAPLTPSTLVDCEEIILGIIPEHLS